MRLMREMLAAVFGGLRVPLERDAMTTVAPTASGAKSSHTEMSKIAGD